MGYTVNQVRHFYVATNENTDNLVIKHEGDAKTAATDRIQDTDVVGTLKAHINKDKDHLYFEYQSPGGTVRSDLIHLSKISYVKHTPAKEMRHILKQYKVAFKDPAGNVSGEHVTKINFKRFLSMNEDDMQFAISGYSSIEEITASDYVKYMAYDLAKSVMNSFGGLVEVALETGGNAPDKVGTLVPITEKVKLADLGDTYTGIIITEKPLKFKRGWQHTSLGTMFEVETSIYPSEPTKNPYMAVEIPATNTTEKRFVENGYKIADMEWFYHGTRGDIYRGVNYPYNFDTEYVADHTKEYDVLDIHYAFSDQGVSTYNSEKDITIAGSSELLTAIKDAIKEEAKAKGTVIEEC